MNVVPVLGVRPQFRYFVVVKRNIRFEAEQRKRSKVKDKKYASDRKSRGLVGEFDQPKRLKMIDLISPMNVSLSSFVRKKRKIMVA